ncbi:AMP-binding protein [Sodalis ligni]|jgi:non-ribosomal peptide synthetase component F|uniref:AMP-binding enzyme n=1 Tax=Sodalis ligni TaxID=2697027 RepID=A0A4R1NA41_9GAMM|nr:AMP-binding protein [Sodalis ligni]QWA12327.1 AMP-binding protein [Sodalis ligni]TCL04264.1 AMP-binding enzyme [Sodalis ligni]
MVQLSAYARSRSISDPTLSAYPAELALSELFLQQAALNKTRPAIITPQRILHYGELARDAVSLAAYLRHQGVDSATTVGIMLPPGIEHITCQVAIMLAGGCCLPLDPFLADDRLNGILRDSRVLLTLSDALTLRRSLATRYIVFEQVAVGDGNDQDFIPLRHGISQPSHRFYRSDIQKTIPVYPLDIFRQALDSRHVRFNHEDRVAAIAPMTAVASLFEIWGALLNGAATVVMPDSWVNDPRRFETALREFAISILRASPAMFNLLASIRPDCFGQLNYLLVGGESVNAHSMRRVLQYGPPRHLLYGDGSDAGTRLMLAESTEH